jgi:uncharacterized protein
VRIDVTAEQIRLLLRLVERNGEAGEVALHAFRSCRVDVPRGLPRPVLERYRSLMEAGRCPPIVVIERGVCSGCQVRLPTMLEQQAARAPALYTCPQCRRMLYARDVVREESQGSHQKPSRPETPESAGRRT